MKKILITGAVGFIGSHLVRYILKNTDWDIISLDRYDTSGNLNRLAGFINKEDEKRIKIVYHDLKAAINEFTDKAIGQVDYIVHMAASTHVDRSTDDPMSFMLDNVIGTTNILNWARKGGLVKGGRFINFSTDEVFGPAPEGVMHKEDAPHKPSNPYSASKAGQEDIGYAFFVTYGLPVITTHTMNNFGETQHPEKLIPKTIRSVIEGTPMPIFAQMNDKGVMEAVGSRVWIHATNTASAVMFLLRNGIPGEAYNIIGFDELTNLAIAQKVADIIGKPFVPEFIDFYKVRPGHDRRYALDGSKMRSLGWKPEVDFDNSLRQTVEWTVNHKEWI